MHGAGEDKDHLPVCGVLLPEQEAAGQAGETEGRGEPRRRGGAADKCMRPLLFLISASLLLL